MQYFAFFLLFASVFYSFHSSAEEKLIYGISLDKVSPLAPIVSSLSKFTKYPTVRMLLNDSNSPHVYLEGVKEIRNVSDIIGVIYPGSANSRDSVDRYFMRMEDYLNTLGDYIDYWIVGDNINAEWVLGQGQQQTDNIAKMKLAYARVKGRGKYTVLALVYNQGCTNSRTNEMFSWAQSNVPDEIKMGLDYVLVNYYQEDCGNRRPDWQDVFDRLGRMFPNSRMGFGEIKASRKNPMKDSLKKEYIRTHYSMSIRHSRFIGGVFWPNFIQDMVPHSKELWKVLNETVSKNALLPDNFQRR